ncbi:hypothetical protein SAMN05661096_02357 [Marivirga sericea]|uniref:Uncharacterized protein n=1 Tax=Marivirga sericea TaxID=1028 RepID=A0A1X7K4P9_9BACT|nr:hypothetical protein [Marivirga sericea]SMG35576.1 hypothetical protein SAMN05661096_02357 [Marivirga sericea]
MKSIYALILTVLFYLFSTSVVSAQSFLEKVAQAAGEKEVEKVPFRFINGTKQPLSRIILKHNLTGEETIYKEGIAVGEEATFDVPSGKSKLTLVFNYDNSQLKAVVFRDAMIKGKDAWLKLDEPEDWDKLKNYKPDDLPAKVHECVMKIDANADGIYNALVYYEKVEDYSAYFSKFDDNADGKIDRMVSPNYNKSGRAVGTKWDTDGDGTWDSVHTMLYKGDAFMAHEEIVEYNGQTVWELRNIVDSIDARILIRKEWDTDSDGKVNKIQHFKRDQNGSIIAEEWDYDADGTIDERTVFDQHPDKSYLRIKEKKDTSADGKWDQIIAYEYDENNFRNKVYYDLNGDKEWDKIELVKRIKGKHEFTEVDLNADGTVDRVSGTKSKNGRLQSTYADENNDGVNEEEVVYFYDLAGNLSKKVHDLDGDGQPDKVVKYDRSCREGYDENGPIFSF